jgi:hypothetical protein
MNGETVGEEVIIYSRDYDVRDFNARIAFVKNLRGAGYRSEIGMKEAQKAITADITRDPELQKAIDAEIDKSKPEPEPQQTPSGFPAKGE